MISNNQRGSALILGIALTPFLLALIFGVSYFFHIILLQTKIQKACFQNPRSTQSNIIPQLEKLMSLNTPAKILKALQIKTQLELATALAAVPISTPLIIALQLQLSKIRQQRLTLDKTQKLIILSASQMMQKSIFTTNQSLHLVLDEFQKIETG